MGLFDIFSSIFSNKNKNSQSTPLVQPNATVTQQTPVEQTNINTPTPQPSIQTPIEEPASVKSIDDLLKENESKMETQVNTQVSTQPIDTSTQAPSNPAEPAPGIGTTHTTNSLHANEASDNKEESSGVRDISL